MSRAPLFKNVSCAENESVMPERLPARSPSTAPDGAARQPSPRVGVLSANPLMRLCLLALLRTLPGIFVVDRAGNDRPHLPEVKFAYSRDDALDILVIITCSADEFIRLLPPPQRPHTAKTSKATPIILLCPDGRPSPELEKDARRKGVQSILTAEENGEELAAALYRVVGREYRGSYTCQHRGHPENFPAAHGSTGTSLGEPDPEWHEPLTRRERDVAELAASGLSNEEIAARLFLSVASVKTYLNRVFEKLGIQRRSQITQRIHWE
ncbi:MAG: LuxR C-terminal-related transcriptional regulator [Armatimonadota bacterium]